MSEAKVEFEKRFGGMTPDHPCVPDVWMSGFEAGKSSRDGLRSQLRSNNTVLFDVASLVGAGKYFDAIELCHAKVFGNNQALEDDGEGR